MAIIFLLLKLEEHFFWTSLTLCKGGRRKWHFLKPKLKVNKGTQLKKELQVWDFAWQLLYRGTIWNCEETAAQPPKTAVSRRIFFAISRRFSAVALRPVTLFLVEFLWLLVLVSKSGTSTSPLWIIFIF